MVAKTAYLGVIIGYRAWESDTTARRVKAAQHCYSILKRWLQAQSIPTHVRFRLYQQCVVPTVLYGVHEMGLPLSCCKRIGNMINVHYRRMTHSPVHLTHENTTDFFNRLAVQPPWTYIAEHHSKLTTALAIKARQMMESAEPQPDVCTLSPAYPPCDMNAFVPPSPPLPQASLACPECHRHFAQAGMLKKHLRQQHQVLCLPEDVFQPLRDSFDGRSVCRHCKHHFTTLYALRDHINKRVCHAFDAAQAAVQPIVARDELRMHIRHRSFMGLMLDQALCSELATRCAFCNLQVHARAMTRNYTDSHPELVGPAKQQYDFVSGLSNLVSGKGQCPMCQCKSLDLQKHTCAVMYQLAAMSGHVMSPDHFPIMPLRTRPWSATVPSGPEPSTHEPPTEPAPKRAKTEGGGEEQMQHSDLNQADRPQAALHKCQTCQACFLSLNGLTTHQQTAHTELLAVPPPAKKGRPTGTDTIAHRLRATTTEIPVPVQEFECPLCFEHLGRKAVANHLRTVHQIDKPSSFPFRPSLDMFPGRLSCMHCKASFTMAFALKNHFDRGTCPVLLMNWVRDTHYGPKVDSQSPPAQNQPAVPLPTQGHHSTWALGLILGTDSLSTMDLRHSVQVTIARCIQFQPERRLIWYTFVMRWTIHFHDLPQVAMNLGTALHIIRWIVEPLPVHWAWHSVSMDTWWDPSLINPARANQLALHCTI